MPDSPRKTRGSDFDPMEWTMKRTFSLLAVAAVLGSAFLISPAGARPAQASGCVQLYKVYFNSPGADNGTNLSLNGEYVQVKNKCTNARTLTGWRIKDAQGHAYTFGTLAVKAGGIVTVRTGKGTNTSTTRYWGSRYYIWNNSGDTAFLRNAAGTTVDSCRFSGAGSYIFC